MTGPAGRRRAVVLGAVLILASVAAFAIALDRGRGPEKSEVVTAGPSSTTTTPGVGRRQVLADRAGGWTLFVVGDGHRRCLEVVVDRQPFGSLLCDAKPATDVIGDLVSFETELGRTMVAIVAPDITGFDARSVAGGRLFPGGQAARDRDIPDLAYAAGPIGGEASPVELILTSGEDTVAKATVPASNGVVGPPDLALKTSSPYGRRPGFRRAGASGFVFGGHQEIGFYDGTGGVACVLYRRFGGMAEGILVDECPAATPVRGFSYAALLPAGVPTFERNFLPVIVTDVSLTAWRCELSTGADCPAPLLLPDPRGSGRTLLADFASLPALPPGGTFTAVLLDGTIEVGRVDLRAP